MRPERAVEGVHQPLITNPSMFEQHTLVGHVLVGDLATGIAGELRARPGAVELFIWSARHVPFCRTTGIEARGHSRKP